MPPVILWAVGALGVLAAARILMKAARRANAELDDIRLRRAVERPVETLERDPATGEYRPRKP
jgi:hypothetical protein